MIIKRLIVYTLMMSGLSFKKFLEIQNLLFHQLLMN